MQITDEQQQAFEDFISKLETGVVRSNIERVWDTVKRNGFRMTTEQLDKVNDFSTHLPVTLQSFPQTFSRWVKDEERTAVTEANSKMPEKEKTYLGNVASDALEAEKVKDKNIEDLTVAPTENHGNKEADEILPEIQEAKDELTEEAKAGDLERDPSAIDNDEPLNKGLEKKIETKKRS